MVKIKKAILLGLLLLLVMLACLPLYGIKTSNAEIALTDDSVCTSEDKGVSTYGLITNLTFSLDGENGNVW